jgi:MFS transporter, OFA family, oxalate/formate antiporter
MEEQRSKYGWVVVAGLFCMYAISNGFALNTIPLFFKPMSTELGINQEQIQRGPSLLFVLIAFMAPIMGRLLDRLSARLLISIGAVGLAITILWFSQISSYTHFIGFYVAYSVFLTLGGIISSVYLITQWFDKNRGKAIGIFLTSSSAGAALLNPIAGKLIKEQGWHQAAFSSGLVAATLLLLPLFVIRNRAKPTTQIARATAQTDRTLASVLKDYQFYLLLVGTGVMWFCIYGIINNQPLYLADLKLDPAQSGKIIGTFFGFSILGKLIFGTLSDYFDKKIIMLLAMFTLAIGSFLLKLSAQNPSLLAFYPICYGIGFSGVFTMIQLLVASLYQGKNYGSILGVVTMIDTLCGALGAYVLGNLRKTSGSYDSAFTLMIVLCGVAIVSTFLLKTTKSTAHD